MLTSEENELLTRVGPGTPAGELLRRYWHPVLAAVELTAAEPKKRIRILGEDLVIFQDGNGRYGLLGEHCAHRGTSLYYGTVEDDGLRCAYHGWKYDVHGSCLEQPFEPQESGFKDKIRQRAYPVERLAGLLFAYMGPPERKPLLPRWDVVAREDGNREINVHDVLNCNWLQAQENTPDLVHGYYLHAHQFRVRGMQEGAYRNRPIQTIEFDECEWGLRQRRIYADRGPGAVSAYPLVFPNMMRLREAWREVMHWRVPIDDYHTRVFWIAFDPSPDGRRGERLDDPPVTYVPYRDERGDFLMNTFPSQDAMAWETQGPLFDRSQEHLGVSDKGIVKFRRMLKEQIAVVEKGGDPIALVRDPEKNKMIPLTTLQGTPDEGMGWIEMLEGKLI